MKKNVKKHEWVDLGLPSGTLWATCNVGAEKPEEYGDYFAWGETEPKECYDWETYKHCAGSSKTQTKYNPDSEYGTVDDKAELDTEDDAAFVNWGEDWCIPNMNQCTEILDDDNTTTKWTTRYGVHGSLIISKFNGKSIFLPAAGSRSGLFLHGADLHCCYWSHPLCSDNPFNAWGFGYGSGGYGFGYGPANRRWGFSVRPVRSQVLRNQSAE